MVGQCGGQKVEEVCMCIRETERESEREWWPVS